MEFGYVIQNGEYYLSNKYEKAAEMVLGYGGVFSKNNVKVFDTKKEAYGELMLMRRFGTGRTATIQRVTILSNGHIPGIED